MKKIACIFPGQGSQEVGMAAQLCSSPISADIFEQADRALEIDLTSLIMNGPEDELTLTFNAQPAILTTSIAAWKHLQNCTNGKLMPTFMAGHSLGEFSALTAAGSLSFYDAVRLVRKRGELMQSAVPVGTGSMAALMGGSEDDVMALINEVAQGDILDIANINAPGQIVISGHSTAIERAVQKSKDFGFKKAVQLNVSAPFHSRLMVEVRFLFGQELERINITEPICPVIQNVDAKPNSNPELIRKNLVAQIDSSVKWVESVDLMIRSGVNVFIEVGHGSVLQGLVKKIAGRDWHGDIIGFKGPEDVQKVLAVIY